jgi:hypothetical protein
MHAENLIVNERRKTEVIKDLGTVSPHINRTIFPQTFIIKSIDLRDLSAFMISTNQCDAVRISHLNERLTGGKMKRSTLVLYDNVVCLRCCY